MFKGVFISYAAEDFKYAEQLYNFLDSKGFQPWMDKAKLLPGQNWDFVIQQELRKADFIILLLSDISVSKRGYVQKEFNQALLYCEEKLDSDIFIIPILINSCNIPTKLSKFQWIEYSTEDSFEKILESLNIQRSILIKEKKLNEARRNGIGFKEKELKGEYGQKSPKQLYEIKYPEFVENSNESLNEINISIQNEILNHLKRARKNYFEHLENFEESYFGLMKTDSSVFGKIHFQLISKNFISYTSFWSLYETGAAHGNYWTIGNNFYLNPVREFDLEFLFSNYKMALPKIRDLVHEKLMQKAEKELGIKEPSDFYLYDDKLIEEEKNFNNYYFKRNSIVFVYNPYDITAYALGDHHPEITYDELINNFPSERKLHEFIGKIKIEKYN